MTRKRYTLSAQARQDLQDITLGKQVSKATTEDGQGTESDIDKDLMVAYTYDPTDQEQAIDAQATIAIEQGQGTYQVSDRRKLRGFIQAAAKLKGAKDAKLQAAMAQIGNLLAAGFNPIVWCLMTYPLQTAEPVADLALALKQSDLAAVLASLDALTEELATIAQVRSQALAQSHRRVRGITKEGQVRVRPQLPLDILGVYALKPGT